jgi:hypothetical protein
MYIFAMHTLPYKVIYKYRTLNGLQIVLKKLSLQNNSIETMECRKTVPV